MEWVSDFGQTVVEDDRLSGLHNLDDAADNLETDWHRRGQIGQGQPGPQLLFLPRTGLSTTTKNRL